MSGLSGNGSEYVPLYKETLKGNLPITNSLWLIDKNTDVICGR